jgi:DNA-binding CsgD family transcriptional regulator
MVAMAMGWWGEGMEVQAFTELVAAIYAVALDADGWQRLLTGMADFFGCSSAAMRIVDMDDFHVVFEMAMGTTDAEAAAFTAHFSDVLPHLEMLKTVSNHYASDVFVVGDHEVVRLELADALVQRLEQNHTTKGFVFKADNRIVHIAMPCPPVAEAGERFSEALPLLAPHLQRAFLIAKRMVELKYRTGSMEQAMNRFSSGVILLDGHRTPVYLNRRAREVVARMQGLHIVSGQLVGSTMQATHRIRQMVADAIEQAKGGGDGIGAMAVQHFNEERINLAIVVVPLHAEVQGMTPGDGGIHAALLIGSPAFASDLKPEVLQLLANLTGTEAKLALGLASGQTLGQYCNETGIQISTARGYLKQVFLKTGTNRQSDLVGLLRSIPFYL